MADVILNPDQEVLQNRLAAVLQPLDKMAIALSGGVDSVLLLAAAARILGKDRILAVTVNAPMVPASDFTDAKRAAQAIGVRQIIIDLPDSVLDEPAFRNNPADRCYQCKKIIFSRIKTAASQAGFLNVADGTNSDDLKEDRPGLLAIREMNIICPLAEAGINKIDIRKLAAAFCPEFAEKPAMACLATRILQGFPITVAALRRIDEAEQRLRANGFSGVRVRDHQDLARVELNQQALKDGLNNPTIQLLRTILHQAGFKYFTLDLDGYRSGSMQSKAINYLEKDDDEDAVQE